MLRPLLLSVLIAGAVVTLSLVYFNPSISWTYGLVNSAVCSNVVGDAKVTPSTSGSNVTVLLVWFLPFGSKGHLGMCKAWFNIDGCQLTLDRKMYSKADGVLIHHRDISWDLKNLPQSQRPPFQKWIWMNMESPSNSPNVPGLANLFNLTVTYRLDADIPVPSGSLSTNWTQDFVIPNKTKLVCWIVSNWNQNHARARYYNELKKHVKIEVFGRAFNNTISDDKYASTMTSCKFYLAFENSIHKDYITEKLFNPLAFGTVPVVLGPSRQNYESLIPGDAFIHVDDFKSAKELADRLRFLDKDGAAYQKHFGWRRYFKLRKPRFWTEHACRACEHVKKQYGKYEAFHNLDKWYWG